MRQAGHCHAVAFYEDAASLGRVAGDFLAAGLTLDHPALVITTTPHRYAITRQLAARGIAVDRASALGTLTVLDARETLSTCLCKGRLDEARFVDVAARALAGATIGRPAGTLRAYGELVDLLWKDGQHDVALRLEVLWKQLASTWRCSLLCGYAMSHAYEDAALDAICRQHTHVVPTTGDVAAIGR